MTQDSGPDATKPPESDPTPPTALICIPHFFRRDSAGAEPTPGIGQSALMETRDSLRQDDAAARRQRRIACVEACLFQLRTLFEAHGRWAARHQDKTLAAMPNPFALSLDICLVTDGENHLIEDLPLPEGFFRQVIVDDPPEHLGYACHRLLAEALEGPEPIPDWFVYMEDDLIIQDPLFFHKIALFNRAAEASLAEGALSRPPVLQPHRWEDPLGAPAERKQAFLRSYPDYELTPDPVYQGPVLALDFLGHSFRMEPSRDPHAGCFFLNQAQMAHIAQEPTFWDPSQMWTTPLDSAATLAVARAFTVYKPMLDSTAFLELRHGAPLMLWEIQAGATGEPPRWEF
ncbi:MAG: hypothetical protein ACPGOY_17795 [Rhodospirillaceae bacterium]